MNNLIKIISLTFYISCYSQTQAEMNQQAYDEFNKADKKLNEVYQNILLDYKSDTIFLKNLKNSQRIWIQFRDAELKMKFPNYPDHIYGSMHPICRAFYLKDLTEKRIKKLEEWLDADNEFDGCDGSVRMKN